MSCFVCRPDIFKSVAKVCFHYGIRQISRGDYPVTVGDLDEFVKKLAELNCKNVSIRYKRDVETEVELFEEIPLETITKQDIADCHCWYYQTCDYCDDDPLCKLVLEASDWAEKAIGWKDSDLVQCNWG